MVMCKSGVSPNSMLRSLTPAAAALTRQVVVSWGGVRNGYISNCSRSIRGRGQNQDYQASCQGLSPPMTELGRPCPAGMALVLATAQLRKADRQHGSLIRDI
jgi:hypothetical protein